MKQRHQETIQIAERTEVETHITQTSITNMTFTPGAQDYRTKNRSMESYRGEGIRSNEINLIHGKNGRDM